MRKLIVIFSLLLGSCRETFIGDDGNMYKVERTCIDEDGYYYMQNNNTFYVPDCDSYKVDTIKAN